MVQDSTRKHSSACVRTCLDYTAMGVDVVRDSTLKHDSECVSTCLDYTAMGVDSTQKDDSVS